MAKHAPTPPLPPAERYLSRHVIVDGEDLGLCLVSFDAHGRATAEPFTAETPGTAYIDTPLEITSEGGLVMHNE